MINTNKILSRYSSTTEKMELELRCTT